MNEINIKCKQTPFGPMFFLPHDSYVGRSIDLYGEFSIGEQAFFNFAARGGAVIDVGANIGAHSLPMSQKYGHVYCFEPQPVPFRLLAANMADALNSTLYHAAVGNEEGVIHLPQVDYAKENNFGGLGKDSFSGLKDILTFPVQIRKLDKVEALHKEDKIDLIKVDVEGMELEVLEGAQQLIDRHRPLMYVENDRPNKMKELVQFIYNLDYKAFWHMTNLYNPDNFYKNPENVFGNVVSYNLICTPNGKGAEIHGADQCSPDNLGPPPGFML